jgi:galactose mutarotase-like enzyme
MSIMSITLKSGPVSKAVLMPERGGLLASLKLDAGNGTETSLLWLPDQFNSQESGWPGGGMPLLFPFAGRVFHGAQPLHYALGDQIWRMPIHGFAYGQPWQILASTADSAELGLLAGPRTRDLFPFEFDLRAKYKLAANKLVTEVTVTNLGGLLPEVPRMPVALGWHPYFRLPLRNAEQTGNRAGKLRLKTTATSQVRVTPAGSAGKTAAFPDTGDGDVTDLNNKLLHNLILGDHTDAKATIIDEPNNVAIDLAWSDYSRYLVLWTQPEQGFHCVEPWMGLPDALNNGEGLAWLEQGASLNYRFSIGLRQPSL